MQIQSRPVYRTATNRVIIQGDSVARGPKLLSISKNLWPPISPDLTPADYFLWGLLKGKVYKNTPRTIEQLKEAMRQEIQAVNVDTLGKLFYHQLDA